MSKNTRSNTIRIIAGQWRGRRIPVLDITGLRPTTDRVRETVFNWLMNDIAGARCLDVFAGTGVLGLECLSRGAEYVQFIEKNLEAVNLIKQSIKTLSSGKINKSSFIKADAISRLKNGSEKKFNIVFLDPPFDDDLIESSAALLEENQWLADQAIIYIESDVKHTDFKLPINWRQLKRGMAGQSAYYLYKRVG